MITIDTDLALTTAIAVLGATIDKQVRKLLDEEMRDRAVARIIRLESAREELRRELSPDALTAVSHA